MTIPVFITARLGSTRLPRKHLLDFGGMPVIEHIVKRCQHFGFEPYILVPKGEEKEFEEVTSCLNVFGGDPEKVITRLYEAAAQYKIAKFHHLDGDDPFFCPRAIEASFKYSQLGIVFPPIESEAGSAICGTSYMSAGAKWRLPWPPGKAWPQRLTLDYPEDYHLLLAVNRMVGGYMAPRWAVDDLFIRNPDLHKINWFRTEEWKRKQLSEQSRSRL